MRFAASLLLLFAACPSAPELVSFQSIDVHLWGPDLTAERATIDPWLVSPKATATVRLWADAEATQPYAAGVEGFTPVVTIALEHGKNDFSTGALNVPLLNPQPPLFATLDVIGGDG